MNSFLRCYSYSFSDADSEILLKEFVPYLSDSRLQRTMSYRNMGDRIRSASAYMLLRYVLHREIPDYSEGQFPVREDEKGKPYIDKENFFFNLSHSGNHVICVVSDTASGCDIEEIKGRDLSLANRFFSPKEQDFFHAASTEEEKKDRFFFIWTGKESYLKMRGIGLTVPLTDVSIEAGKNAHDIQHTGTSLGIKNITTFRVFENGTEIPLSAYSFRTAGYRIAVTADSIGGEFSYQEVSRAELLM